MTEGYRISDGAWAREYGPPTAICNRSNRWSRRGQWQFFEELAALAGLPQE